MATMNFQHPTLKNCSFMQFKVDGQGVLRDPSKGDAVAEVDTRYTRELGFQGFKPFTPDTDDAKTDPPDGDGEEKGEEEEEEEEEEDEEGDSQLEYPDNPDSKAHKVLTIYDSGTTDVAEIASEAETTTQYVKQTLTQWRDWESE